MEFPFVGSSSQAGYRGRFAPTPSGPLHLGSLLTALASYLQARQQKGRWLLRIDDLDRPRIAADAEGRILRQLEAHGLLWDDPPRRQSDHLPDYHAALDRLRAQGLIYACACTRAQLMQQSLPGPDGLVYNGHCRGLGLPEEGLALRLRVPTERLQIIDAGQGGQSRQLERELGDFVLRRRDGIFGYQLACAVDEHAQGITEVVRGVDLLSSTFFQLHLMHRLRLRVPSYRHLPLLTDTGDRKLSKQNHAVAIEESQASHNLSLCLELLGQNPPPALKRASVTEIVAWGITHWSAERIPKRHSLVVGSL